MATHNSNPLMKWIAGAAALGGIGFLLFSPSKKGPDLAGAESGSGQNGTQTVQHPAVGIGGESNSTAETLNTLLGEVKVLNAELDKERRKNEQRIEAMKQEMEGIKTSPPAPNMPAIPGSEDTQLLKKLENEIASLRSMLPGSNPDGNTRYDIGIGTNEYPAGSNSGIPSLSNPYSQKGGNVAPPINDDQGGWITPMDMTTSTNQRGEDIISLPDLTANPMFNNPIRRTQNAIHRQLGVPGRGGDSKESSLIPVYTIPADGTLVKAVTRTALLGRIPLGGTVTDPYRFKLLIGSENLASNGHRIPGLHGMVVSGVAKGDYTLKCVSGDITSITYTFTDGTVRTIQSESGGENGKGRLGFIADEQGVPCISGQLISNAPEYLTQSIAVDMFAAAAGAFADQEKVFNTDNEGNTSSQVTGNPWNNMAGEGVKAGANTASDYVKQRQQSAFDAIYTPTGTMVEVHLEKQIEIDYDTNGRKVAHHAQTNYGSSRGLD